jgi:polygalacturonase
MMKYALGILATIALAADFAPAYNIRTFGASGAGKSLDTAAIQRTI